jgi:hypothetical protein
MDKYEASVWYVPPSMTTLIRRIQNGGVTLANLTAPNAAAAGVVQLGLVSPLPPTDPGDLTGRCPLDGNGCVDVYAVSIAGVLPSVWISWPQAAAAARNSLKRLPTNQEWQVAALGTPDGAPCNQDDLKRTGSIPACVSDVGAFDMVGNVWEWVADWAAKSLPCAPLRPPLFPGNGGNCFAGVATDSDPGGGGAGTTALTRGFSGVYDVVGVRPLAARELSLGFRAVR